MEEIIKKQQFIIHNQLPGLNEYVDACRSHATKGNAMKKEAEALIAWEIRLGNLKPIESPAFLLFSWLEPDWRRDADNIAFAKKFILDALVTQKILKNDSRKEYVLGFFDFFPLPQKKRSMVGVEILELAETMKPSDAFQSVMAYIAEDMSKKKETRDHGAA